MDKRITAGGKIVTALFLSPVCFLFSLSLSLRHILCVVCLLCACEKVQLSHTMLYDNFFASGHTQQHLFMGCSECPSRQPQSTISRLYWLIFQNIPPFPIFRFSVLYSFPCGAEYSFFCAQFFSFFVRAPLLFCVFLADMLLLEVSPPKQ